MRLGEVETETGAAADAAGEGLRLFECCGLARPKPWKGLALSLGLHCIGVWLLIAAGPYLDILATETEPLRFRVALVEPLRLEIPQPSFVAQAAARARRLEREPGERRARGGRGAPGRAPSGEARAGEFLRAAARRFELPESRHREPSPHVVLQPGEPPRLPLPAETKLPTLLFWAFPKLPAPPARRFIAPGSAGAAETAPVLDAPPRLEPPNREAPVSDLRLANLPVLSQPKLPRPASSAAPVRQFVAPVGERTATPAIIESLPGEPINVLALSEAPTPVSRMVVLPLGSFAGRLPPPGAGSSLTGGAAEGAGVTGAEADPAAGGAGTAAAGSSAGGGSAAGDAGTGAGRLSGGGTGIGGTAGSGGEGGGVGGTGMSAGAGGGTGISGSGRGAGRAGTGSSLPSSVATRVEHPVTAVFDVVVEGGLPAPGDRQSRGILSGRPIYTVYVPVGTGKQWLMQYCVPNQSAPTRVSAGVVSLGTTAPVRAPYPRTTVVPPAELLPTTNALLIHGYIGTSGGFEELRAVYAEQTAAVLPLLGHLQQWIFRPAVQGGAPVRVEVLLVIPPATR